MSPNTELALVVLLAFGYFIFVSVASAPGGAQDEQLTDDALASIVIYELLVILLLFPFLLVRGWHLSAIGLKPSLKETLDGLAITAFFYLVYLGLAAAFVSPSTLAEPAQSGSLISPTISLALIVAVCIVNPVFEEVFVCGYVMSAIMERAAPAAAIAASVGIRVLYHLYQGPAGAAAILLLGLIFSLYYVRTGRLWPLIVAHSVLDFVALFAVYDQPQA